MTYLKAPRRRKNKRKLSLFLVLVFVLVSLGVLALIWVFRPKIPEIPSTNRVASAKSSLSSLSMRPIAEDTVPLPTLLTNEIYSKHAILLRLDSVTPICEKAAYEKTYPASLTKIMTAIIAIENLPDLEKTISLSQEIFDTLTAANSSFAGFSPNEEVKAIDLLYGILLPSGGEACLGIAQAVAGSELNYVELMNQKAVELGMNNTHFMNTSGLHDENHYTTVRDIAVLLKYALKNELFRTIFTATHYSTSPTALHPDGITFTSSTFDKIESYELTNDYIIGGKTGFTLEASLCLASLAKKDGKEYIFVSTEAEGSRSTEKFAVADALTVYAEYAK